MAGPATRAGRWVRRERRSVAAALLASILLHLAALVLLRSLPAAERAPRVEPVRFTLVERSPPATVAPVPGPRQPPPPGSSPGGRPGRRTAPPAPPASGPREVGGRPDTPLAEHVTPGPSLQEMSERAAEAVVGSRGPLHPAGDSVGDRVAQVLKRGSGEMAVGRSGFWDAYFTVLRKALMTAWPAEQSRTWTDQKRSTRIRLVIDAEGLVRDFEVIIVSGDRVMDREVEQVLHACAQLPPPPPGVMQGKTELVTEWQLTVHPGLAAKQGSYGFGYGSGITFGAVFDMVTLFDPHIDLTPLERNVTLASYWTR